MTPAEALMNSVQWRETGMTDDGSGLPYATHEGVLSIGGVDLKCYQLNDGRRIFDAESVTQFFAPLDTDESYACPDCKAQMAQVGIDLYRCISPECKEKPQTTEQRDPCSECGAPTVYYEVREDDWSEVCTKCGHEAVTVRAITDPKERHEILTAGK